MKIALITFHCADSHGAALQTLGLCNALAAAGHQIEVIDYRPAPIADPPDWRRTRFFGLHPAHMEWWTLHRKFRSFRTQHLALSPRTYRSFEELAAHPPEADAYVCGSDQIWNPVITGGGFDPAYFLEFAPAGRRRIAYAASFGGGDLPDTFHSGLLRHLENLQHVACREPAAAAFVSGLTGRQIPAVLDPTFLWSGWNGLAVPRRRSPAGTHVFSYTLQQNPTIPRVLAAVQEELNAPVRCANGPWKFWTQPGRPVYPDPAQWLGWIRNARAVVTDSFHGTVFAILFEVPFVTLPLAGRTAFRNTRITELLEMTGLTHRLVSPDNLPAIRQTLTTPIDWNTVRGHLAPLRERSARYLREALA